MSHASSETIASLTRKLERCRAKNAELSANVELLEMMVHDLAAPIVIAAIAKKYPAVAKSWELP